MDEESDQERAARYLKMAAETAGLAQRAADPSSAEGYMSLATIWTKMADELMGRRPANDDGGAAEDEARA